MNSEISIGGVPQELLETQIGNSRMSPEVQVISAGVLSAGNEVAGALSSAPGTDENIENFRPEEIPLEVLPGTIDEYLKKEREVVNEAEVYQGVLRPDDFAFKTKNRSSRKYALWGLLPLNTRNRRELYNLLKDARLPAIVIPLLWGLTQGFSILSQQRTEALRQSQLVPGMVDLLDPQKDQSGEFIKNFIENNSGGIDLNNVENWPKGSNLRSVAGTWAVFWDMLADPKSRNELANQLPLSARAQLTLLPNRKLTDAEIEDFLIKSGVKKANAHLLAETVRELKTGKGDVSSALNDAQKK